MEQSAGQIPCFETTAAPSSCSWQTNLGRIIESEIIPRLVLCNLTACPVKPKRPLPPDNGILDLAELVLDPNPSAALAFIERLQMQGLPAASILLDYLAPAARHLGNLWSSDDRDFIEVSVGLYRLQNLMNELTGGESHKVPCTPSPKALFMLAPGEVHGFGLSMVEMFFRNAGWQTCRSTAQNYQSELKKDWYAMIGFSLSCERYLDALKTAIRKARLASKNPSLLVLAGGPIFIDNPSLIQAVGADASGTDAADAVLAAQTMLELSLSV